MNAIFLGIDTEVEWINSISSIPILGHVFLFLGVFIPPVLISFLIQAIIPGLHSDVGFTKAMLFLLPAWNIALWLLRIKPYIFFLPTWILFAVISIVKTILMIRGIDSGQ